MSNKSFYGKARFYASEAFLTSSVENKSSILWGTALNEIDNLGQNGSVPHSDGTRLEEIPAEVADAKCKGGVV